MLIGHAVAQLPALLAALIQSTLGKVLVQETWCLGDVAPSKACHISQELNHEVLDKFTTREKGLFMAEDAHFPDVIKLHCLPVSEPHTGGPAP